MKREVLNIPISRAPLLNNLYLLVIDEYNSLYQVYPASIYGSLSITCDLSGLANFQIELDSRVDYYKYYLFSSDSPITPNLTNPLHTSNFHGITPVANGFFIKSGNQIGVSSRVYNVLRNRNLVEGRYEGTDSVSTEDTLYFLPILYYGIKRFTPIQSTPQYPTYNG